MRTITTLCLTVVCSMAVSVAGLLAVRAVVPPAYALPSNEICGAYLQMIGTIYAVLLAFVVFVVWTQANDVRRLIERQADELTDVLRITKAFNGTAASKVLTEARKARTKYRDLLHAIHTINAKLKCFSDLRHGGLPRICL